MKIIDELLLEVKQAIFYAEAYNSVPGKLFIRHKGTNRYFRKIGNKEEYLDKNSTKKIKDLEQKAYYEALLKTAKEEEAALEKMKKIADGMPDYKSVFLSIPLERRHLISPYEHKPKVDDDVICVFKPKKVDPEIRLVSQNGEHVRSKSELIIADRLKAAEVPYFYEYPLIVTEHNYFEYWHPDFKVQNKRTGKLYFWEHFGMLDNPDYCTKCQERLEMYAKNGFFPGENLIITSESSGHRLNLDYVDLIIEKYLK